MLPGLDVLELKIAAARRSNDPTGVLLAEHEWLRSILDEYQRKTQDGQDTAATFATMQALGPLLNLHILREEEAYFPAVEEFVHKAGQGSTTDMYGEHDAIRIRHDELLSSLERRGMAGEAFAAFSRALLVHFENEEELVFAEAPQHLTEESRLRILTRFDELALDTTT